MQVRHLIAHAKYDQNFIVLEPATPNKAMQITGYSQPTHLMNKNSIVKVLHYRFGHFNNIKIINSSKFLTAMGNFNKVYNLIKVCSNSKQSNNNSSNNIYLVSAAKALLLALSLNNNFNCLCTLCITSKQTQILRKNKLISKVNKKLNEIYVDPWGPYYPPSLFGKIHVIILLDAKTQKS